MASSGSEQKLPFFALTAIVVGSRVGAGIFSLPRTFDQATGPFGAIIAWCRVFHSRGEKGRLGGSPQQCSHPGSPTTAVSTDGF